MHKTVVVTGATRGLGMAITHDLLDRGYNVVAIGRRPSGDFKKLLADHQNHLHFFPFDLGNTGMIRGLVASIVKEHGPIYGLVNNAAIGKDGVLATMHEKDIEEVIHLNVLSTIILTKYASRSMLQARQGRVINISSIIADTGFSGLSVYAASKSALNGFTRSLARELGKLNITVNSVAPGYMQTDMTAGMTTERIEQIKRRSPLSRLPEVADVSRGVLFLLSEDAENITGTTLKIDAGSTC